MLHRDRREMPRKGSEVYEALIEAGSSEVKAKAAAEAIPVTEQMVTKQDLTESFSTGWFGRPCSQGGAL